MFWREHARYIIGFLIAIALAILVFSLIFKAIGGQGDNNGVREAQLTDYIGTDAVISITGQGPIVSQQKYQSLRISVDTLQAKIEIMSGYENTVTSSQVFASNGDAFNEFVHALSLSGFDKGIDNPKLENDAGVCATGTRYVMEITQNGAQKQRFWTSTCGGGTFRGNRPATVNLFKAQIPNYSTQVRGITFSF